MVHPYLSRREGKEPVVFSRPELGPQPMGFYARDRHVHDARRQQRARRARPFRLSVLHRKRGTQGRRVICDTQIRPPRRRQRQDTLAAGY
jgi:hypothetical protein